MPHNEKTLAAFKRRPLLFSRKLELAAEAAEARNAIVEGFKDLINGRHALYKGDLRETLKELARRQKQGWR